MESSADVQRPVVFWADYDGAWRNSLAFIQNPGSWASGTVLVEVLCTTLSLLEPVLQSPSLGFFL